MPREIFGTKLFVQALLDLNYNKFVRVGSLKKVARRVLPFTAQTTNTRAGEGNYPGLHNTPIVHQVS
jgi:hypothetical protein